MEYVNVLVAAAAGFALGAVWYTVLANPWMEAAGVERGADGRPANGSNAMNYVATFILQVIVAGMMRHVFAESGIVSLGGGLVAGAGIGAFFITPWIAINNRYIGRPARLTLIDGGYATLACAAIGLVLSLF